MFRLTVFRLAWACALGITFSSFCSAQEEIDPHIQHIIDHLLPPVIVVGEDAPRFTLQARMAALHVPGVSIVYFHAGQIVWACGFGTAQFDGPAIEPDTLFQAGSISKSVAALAVLELVQAGRLDLDRDVNAVLRSWKLPSNRLTVAAPATLRELLSHSAGTNVSGFAGYRQGQPVPTLAQVLNGDPPANSDPVVVERPPGRVYRYSGGGYMVIQQVLDDATGKPFDQLLQDSVLSPLGMEHSSFDQPLSVRLRAHAATPYLSNGDPVIGGAHTYPELAAAGLWTTPSDLARFAIGLQDALAGRPGAIIPQATARLMVTPVLSHYGLGLRIGGSAERPYFWHGGINSGFASAMMAYDSGDGAVVMTNGAQDTLAWELMRGIAAEYGWPDLHPVERTLAIVDPSTFARYIGTYQLTSDDIVSVMQRNGKLIVRLPDQTTTELLPEGENTFFSRNSDLEITFQLSPDGKTTGLALMQAGERSTAASMN